MKQIYRLYGIPCRILFKQLHTALSLILFLSITTTSHAQVNSYAKVTAINGAKTVLTISNRNETYHTFTAGEQVIVMQMQENVIGSNTSNTASFGTLSAIANAGFYEIATISAINGGRTTITLTTALTKTFTIGSNSDVQVISFTKLSTTNFTTTANIPAVAWSGTTGTGGVVAVQVDGILTMKHSITADGAGFAGGAISGNYESSCEPSVYTTSSTNYAAKGEGIYLNTNTSYTYGRAPLLTGGGGGSDDNAGGAGGGNFTAGGDGGPGWTCSASPSGGMGGITLNTYLLTGTRLFMGGGGGGGQGNNSTQTAGATGGGIVIVKAASITTACSASTIRISANGNTASNTSGTGNDGAGGAGAAGTILLQVGSFSIPSTCPLQIQANGGNGGDVTNSGAHGGGGGGGQGAILFSGALPNSSSNITTVTTSGTGGLNSSSSGATRASSGAGTNNSGIIGGIGTVLPVQVLDFAGEQGNKNVLLHWAASSEANTLFNVQHSTNAIDFITIGTVKSTGNSSVVSNYAFTDQHPVTGKNYYRLQISSNNSPATYSDIVTVTMTDVQPVPVAWPNPAHDHFSVRVNSEYSNKNHVVIITDLTGKIMYTNTYKPTGGIITIAPNSPLKPGLYMFKVTSEGYEQTGKLMIQ